MQAAYLYTIKCDRRGIEWRRCNEVALNMRLMLVGSYAHIVVIQANNSLEKILNDNLSDSVNINFYI
ncbi:hypothetical protein Avbf_18695 [Armadillidium vulgare]|nr:hypothetical protein Avbf_18695 [Armadillidium vulgare]